MKRVKKTNRLHPGKVGRPPTSALSKDSPVSLSSETSSSESDSDYDSDSSASPPPEKSPLPSTRPTKAADAMRYDTIKAVWFPRNKFVENERILKGLADFWEVVRTIRERWKNDKEDVKKALEAKKISEVSMLKERVEGQLDMMEKVLKAATEFGHPDLLSAYVYPLPFSFPPYLSAHAILVMTACTLVKSSVDRARTNVGLLLIKIKMNAANTRTRTRVLMAMICCFASLGPSSSHAKHDTNTQIPILQSSRIELVNSGHKNWPRYE